MKWIKLKAKIIIEDHIELIKSVFLLKIMKNIYLKMDIVDYHIFINLLVNRIKNIFGRI